MKEVLKIEIEHPCGENWETFPQKRVSHTIEGYCSSCKKNVLDFSSWGDEAIKAYFKSKPSQVCGRFRSSQLKSYQLAASPEGRHISFLSILLSVILLLFTRLVEAQSIRKNVAASAYHTEKLLASKKPITTTSFLVKGQVTDSAGQVLPGVNVVRKFTTTGTVTDIDGKFTLQFENPKEVETIVISFIGLSTVEQQVETTDGYSRLDVVMDYDLKQFDEVIVAGQVCSRTISPTRWWWNFKDLFRKRRN